MLVADVPAGFVVGVDVPDQVGGRGLDAVEDEAGELIRTALNPSAGVSLGSLNPNTAALNVNTPSSLMSAPLSVPVGGSLTSVTLNAIVFGD